MSLSFSWVFIALFAAGFIITGRAVYTSSMKLGEMAAHVIVSGFCIAGLAALFRVLGW